VFQFQGCTGVWNKTAVKQCCRWSALFHASAHPWNWNKTKLSTVRWNEAPTVGSFVLFQFYFTMCDWLNASRHRLRMNRKHCAYSHSGSRNNWWNCTLTVDWKLQILYTFGLGPKRCWVGARRTVTSWTTRTTMNYSWQPGDPSDRQVPWVTAALVRRLFFNGSSVSGYDTF